MKKFKSIVSVIACFAMLFVSAAAYKDTPENAWYYDSVMKMTDAGIVAGVGNGYFMPDRTVTAAELAIMVARANGTEKEFDPDLAWNVAAVTYAIENGWTDPVEANHVMTREEAIAMIIQSAVSDIPEVENVYKTWFVDSDKVSSEYQNHVAYATYLDISRGVAYDNTFRPQDNITRAEACRFVARAMDSTLFDNIL